MTCPEVVTISDSQFLNFLKAKSLDYSRYLLVNEEILICGVSVKVDSQDKGKIAGRKDNFYKDNLLFHQCHRKLRQPFQIFSFFP